MRNLDYGVIGNCKSAALVSPDGTIEWCCLPHFNSQSVFAKILDRERGGEFGLSVTPGGFVDHGPNSGAASGEDLVQEGRRDLGV